MSLKIRIDLLFGLLLFLGLASDIGRMVATARSRVEAEGQAMTRISHDFAATALANLQGASNPEAGLRQFVERLGALRHVRITFAADGRSEAVAQMAPDMARLTAPQWFYALVGARAGVTILPAVVDGKRVGDLVIAEDPADEVNEVWQDVSSLVLTGGAIALAALFGASLILARTLRPLRDYSRALGRLRDGDYSVRAEPEGSPEFIDLCQKLNALAQALASLSASNADLVRRLMDVQEQERRSIAHELHDEIGPHLFALRANATMLKAALKERGFADLERRATATCDQLEALQAQNRRILRQLRPPALEDLGLGPALRVLVEGWSETDPSVDIDLEFPDDLDVRDPRESLVLYRLVQEALTNIFRHAKASSARIVFLRLAGSAGAAPRLRVRIEDDGVGFEPGKPVGLGLAGMQERMRGLGGSLSFGSSPGGGAYVDAMFPLQSADQTAATS